MVSNEVTELFDVIVSTEARVMLLKFSDKKKDLRENNTKFLFEKGNFVKVGYPRKNIGIISIAQKLCCVLS